MKQTEWGVGETNYYIDPMWRRVTCTKGHLLTHDNVYWIKCSTGKTQRRCSTCDKENVKAAIIRQSRKEAALRHKRMQERSDAVRASV